MSSTGADDLTKQLAKLRGKLQKAILKPSARCGDSVCLLGDDADVNGFSLFRVQTWTLTPGTVDKLWYGQAACIILNIYYCSRWSAASAHACTTQLSPWHPMARHAQLFVGQTGLAEVPSIFNSS